MRTVFGSGLFWQSTSGFEWHDGALTAALRMDGTIGFRSGALRAELTFEGVSHNVQPRAEAASVSEHRYVGSPADWTSRRAYRAVRYDDVYPAIGVLFRTNAAGRLEYDFELRPRADPRRIGVRFDAPVRIDDTGSLLIGDGGAELIQRPPAAYQVKNGAKVPVSARYRIAPNGIVRFELDEYDTGSDLVIDPVLSFATLLDGGGYDSVAAVATDRDGNVYVAGETDSTSFGRSGLRPTRDAFVAKLARGSTGLSVVYVAYLGGASQDSARGIAIDAAGNAYVAGVTASADFPSTPGAYEAAPAGGDDAFVVKLDASGGLVYSTRLGTTGSDSASSVAVNASGHAVVAGYTSSIAWPDAGYRSATAGQGDCFVAELNATGSALVYAALLGGSGLDACTGVAVDSAGSAYVAGVTYSADFPVKNASQAVMKGPTDAFVARLDSGGTSLRFSTFLGGSGSDLAYALAVDGLGNAYVAGATLSTNFPTKLAYQATNHGDYDAYVAELASDGALVFATLLGGSGADAAYAVTVDERGLVIVAGATQSRDIATVNAFQSAFAGAATGTSARDGFVAVLAPTGSRPSLLSYAGGFGDDRISGVAAVNGRIYVAGDTTSFDLPGSTQSSISGTAAYLSQIEYGPTALAFYPVTPCRLIDTRSGYNKPDPFGPPALTASADRTIPIAGYCGVPLSAKAVSMNIAAVPSGPLGYIAAWPAGEPFPGVANLNSPDGTTVANAAMVTLGASGALTFRAWTQYPAHVVVDINGYFDVPGAKDLTLYTVDPCRAIETRAGRRAPGEFGPPALARLSDRSFSLPRSGCGVPATAEAFAATVFALPRPSSSSLGYLSLWPEGLAYPNVSTLNSPTGRNLGNMAIIPAGTPEQGITVRASDATDFLLDVTGYFAPNTGGGALHYYAIAPCRVVDTRAGYGFAGAFGPPALSFRETRDFPLQSGGCFIPSTARAYAINVAVVPLGPSLDYMNMWPAGLPTPNASVLVSPAGLVVATAAIIPAGAGGGAPVSVFASNPTHLIIDVNGYFAP